MQSVSLRSADNSANTTRDNQEESGGDKLSAEDRLKLLDYFLNVLKSRTLFLRSKFDCKPFFCYNYFTNN